MVYLLQNGKRHGHVYPGIDPCCSGWWFDGWQEELELTIPPNMPCPIRAPRTWLMSVGWKRLGLISISETPAALRTPQARLSIECGSPSDPLAGASLPAIEQPHLDAKPESALVDHTCALEVSPNQDRHRPRGKGCSIQDPESPALRRPHIGVLAARGVGHVLPSEASRDRHRRRRAGRSCFLLVVEGANPTLRARFHTTPAPKSDFYGVTK